MNKAADNCSGLPIYQGIHKHIGGLEQAGRNTQDGMSMMQTIDGGLQEVQSNIKRMKELSMQASNATLTDSDREKVQTEVNQLKNAINDIANQSQFNTIKLLNQDANLSIKISDAPDISYNVKLFDCTTTGLNLDNIDLMTEDGRKDSLGLIDKASETVLRNLTDTGVSTNGLEHTYNNLTNLTTNLSISEANIHDTDMAFESMELVRTNILGNVTNSLLAQTSNVSNSDISMLRS